MLLRVPDIQQHEVDGWQEFCWFLEKLTSDKAHVSIVGVGGRVIGPLTSFPTSKSHANMSHWQNANHIQDPGCHVVPNLPAL